MNELTKQFVPYSPSLRLRDLGFDHTCLGMWDTTGMLHHSASTGMFHTNKGIRTTESIGTQYAACAAPLIEQAIEYLGDWHHIYISINWQCIGSDEWEYSYTLTYLPKEFEDFKRRAGHFETKKSFDFYGSNYTGAWSTRYEALTAAITHALKLIK